MLLAVLRFVAIGDCQPREFAPAADIVTIGSAASNDFVIRDATVSRRHATFTRVANGYQLTDLGSTNGTLVNGRRVGGPVFVRAGDEVRFGTAAYALRVSVAERVGSKLGSAVAASGVERQAKDDVGASRAAVVPARSRRRFAATTVFAMLLMGAGFTFYEFVTNFSRLENAATTEPISKQTAPTRAAGATVHNVEVVVAGSPTASSNPSSMAASALAHAASAASAPADVTPGGTIAAPADWLARINSYRAMVNLPLVKEDHVLSDGDAKHARYLILNYAEAIRSGVNLGAAGSHEKAGAPAYSVKGETTADNSDNAYGCGSFNAIQTIDHFMDGPFHRLAILSPGLESAGFGSYADGGCWAAVIRLPVPPSSPRVFERPIEFPPDRSTVALKWADEWPAPLAACTGYEEPGGLPITVQLGRQIDGQLSAHSLTDGDGRKLENCAFDNRLYTNPDQLAQEYGRTVLKRLGAIALIPRQPLSIGVYTVAITARGQAYTWSFTIGP